MGPRSLNLLSRMTDTAMEDTSTTAPKILLPGAGGALPFPPRTVVGVSSMAVSVIPDRKLRLSGSIAEGAAPRDWPTVEPIGLRVGNDRGGAEDMVFEYGTRGLKVCERL